MRLIDADAIPYEPLPKGDRNYRTYNLDDAYEDGYNDAMVDVRNSPTIEERKKGKWIKYEDRGCWHCSECGTDNYYAYVWNGDTGSYEFQDSFCPNCGADMRGEE